MEAGKMVGYKFSFGTKNGVITTSVDELRKTLSQSPYFDSVAMRPNAYVGGYDSLEVTMTTTHNSLIEVINLLDEVKAMLSLADKDLLSYSAFIMEE